MFYTFFEKLLFGSFFTCEESVWEWMQKSVGCRSCAAKIWRSALCYELVPIYATAFFCTKCCMISTMSIFFGYVSMRTGAILNLEGRERLGRDPFTHFRGPSYHLVTKPFVNCCCFQSLDELGLMDYLGNESSKLIKVITAVFYISARHKVEGQL